MRIGFEYMLPGPRDTGVGTAIREALHALISTESELSIDVFASPRSVEHAVGHARVSTRVSLLAGLGRPGRILWQQCAAPFFARSRRIDVYHATGYVASPWMQVPTVVSVYDVTAIEHPELTRWLNARHFGFALPRGVHAATRVVVPSEYVKTRLHVVTGVPLHRIVVLPLGVSTEFRPLARELVERRLDGIPGLQQKPFLLSVGNLERKKQLHVLLAAFARIQNRVHANLQLVFAGKAGNAATELETLAMRLGIRESVSFLGYVDRSALVALYSGAEALVYPSLDEGFGLPPLEAMACGTLAVVSTAGALPETTGGCAVSFHTGDDEHLASVLIAAFESEDERARIEARGRMWSAHFSWDEHARGLLHTYYDVARLSVLGSCPNREPAA